MNTMTNITVNDTIQPLLIDAQEYMRFSGRYYLCDVEYVQTSQAQEKCKLTLSDRLWHVRGLRPLRATRMKRYW